MVPLSTVNYITCTPIGHHAHLAEAEALKDIPQPKVVTYIIIIYFSSILRKSSCPFPPLGLAVVGAGAGGAVEPLGRFTTAGVFLKPKPAFGFGPPTRLGLNSEALSFWLGAPADRAEGASSLSSSVFPPKVIGSVLRSRRPAS